ncbi:hypothetical protein F2P79_024494 [Pimephales promelas]|nr:hypothetical protein F2P79_024494 [Pimephales promelas]
MGYNTRRPHRVPLISTTNRDKRLQFVRAHQNWRVEDWKNVAWSDESRFLLRHSDGPLVSVEHRLNATAYLSIVSDNVHPFMATMYPSSDGYFQQDNAPFTRSQPYRASLGSGGTGTDEHPGNLHQLQDITDHPLSLSDSQTERSPLGGADTGGTRQRTTKTEVSFDYGRTRIGHHRASQTAASGLRSPAALQLRNSDSKCDRTLFSSQQEDNGLKGYFTGDAAYFFSTVPSTLVGARNGTQDDDGLKDYFTRNAACFFSTVQSTLCVFDVEKGTLFPVNYMMFAILTDYCLQGKTELLYDWMPCDLCGKTWPPTWQMA